MPMAMIQALRRYKMVVNAHFINALGTYDGRRVGCQIIAAADI